MTVPVLLNALQIPWVSLFEKLITDCNISTAPLTLVAAVLEAATKANRTNNCWRKLRWFGGT